jgi:hypothetical protein
MVRKTTKKPKPKKRFEFFITTIPKIRPCQRCGSWLAAGITDGMHVKADLTQLSPRLALIAAITNVQMYSLTRTGLVHLDKYRLQDLRFQGRLPEHRCGVVWPAEVEGAGPVQSSRHSDTPPY